MMKETVKTIKILSLVLLLFTFNLRAQDAKYRKITVQELIEEVLKKNNQIEAQRIEFEVTDWQVMASKGIYEPMFLLTYKTTGESHKKSLKEQSAGIWGDSKAYTDNKNEIYETGISGLLPYGTNYRIGYTLSLESNIENESVAPEYIGFLGVEVTQPLLQDFGKEITDLPIHLAENEYKIAHQNLRAELMNIVRETEKAYWSLLLAKERLKNKRESYERSQKIFNDMKTRFEVNKASDLEVHQAKTGMILRKSYVIKSKQGVIQANNGILSLLSVRNASEEELFDL